MKALVKVSKDIQFEIEEDKQTDVFEQISSLHEVFGIVGNEQCYFCKCADLKFRVRQNSDEDKFYEIVCAAPKCGGKLAISVNKKGGTMYPVRKLKNGLPAKISDEAPFDWSTKGWHKYEKDKQPNANAEPAAKTTKK